MKIDNLIVGIIVICFAALLLADAILTTYTPANQILSPNDVKGITGMVFGVIAALISVKAFVKTKTIDPSIPFFFHETKTRARFSLTNI